MSNHGFFCAYQPLAGWADQRMPYFYFHVVNGSGETRDQEGAELPDLEAARTVAVNGIRSILREEIGQGVLDLGGRIRIADNCDKLLLEVPFRSAVEVRNMGDFP